MQRFPATKIGDREPLAAVRKRLRLRPSWTYSSRSGTSDTRPSCGSAIGWLRPGAQQISSHPGGHHESGDVGGVLGGLTRGNGDDQESHRGDQ